MTSANLTRYRLQDDNAFAAATLTIKGSIQPQGSNLGSLPLGTYAKYANTLFTADTVFEGDRIEDAYGKLYDVHTAPHYTWLDQDSHKQAELLQVQEASLFTLALDWNNKDAVAGWAKHVYTESTVYVNFSPKGQSTVFTGAGFYGKYDFTAVTSSVVSEGDYLEIDGEYYSVVQAQPYKMQGRTDDLTWSVCYLVRRDFDLRPDSAGTWHLDSESLRTDPRNRIKTLLDTYITGANIKLADGATEATVLTCFDGADYPLTKVFDTYDAVAVLTRKPSTPQVHALTRAPYAFDEQVDVTLYAVHTSTAEASNLLEQFEQEIRHVLTDYPVGQNTPNMRQLTKVEPKTVTLGSVNLYTTGLQINYRRWNDDLTPTSPSITWGPSAAATGTFTFPNVTYVSPPVKVNNTRLMPPGRMGNVLQKLGMPDAMITIRCDLDMSPDALTWKRPQTTTPKTDVVDWQVFLDIAFNGQYAGTQTYQTLNLGWGGTMQVTLEEVTPIESASSRELELVFYTYNSSSGSVYTTWFGTS